MLLKWPTIDLWKINRICTTAFPYLSLFSVSPTRQYHTNNGIYGHRKRPVESARYTPKPRSTGISGLISAFREHGHKRARIDLLRLQQSAEVPELDPVLYGLNASQSHDVSGLLHPNVAHGGKLSTDDVMRVLEEVYCGTTAVQFEHMETAEERDWFADRYESLRGERMSDARRVEVAKLMLRSQEFDRFLASKFATTKRYGGEGAESAMPFYDELFRSAAPATGVSDIVVCIAHRGRLNLLACLLQYHLATMFQKIKGRREFPPNVVGSGDVLSHLTSSVDLRSGSGAGGQKVHVTMVPNPSHLEAVNPVATGKVRARMQRKGMGEYSEDGRGEGSVLCFQVHGDAAFCAQGIVMETFGLAYLPNYSVGGTIHLIINNQVGYTTEADRARSSANSGDIARSIAAPIIRVNGDRPDDVVNACRLATEYRARFRRDVVVDLVCFRRWGHNELDEPSFTQPGMYRAIRARASIPDTYAKELVDAGTVAGEELAKDTAEWNAELSAEFGKIETSVPRANHLEGQWSGLVQARRAVERWDTGVDPDTLRYVGGRSVDVPEGFEVHPTLVKGHVERRLQKLREGRDIDWATAEALAFGSLLLQGYNVRISGQDVGRGTFSQRHAMLVDQRTDEAYVPLDRMLPGQQGRLEVANSPLSEEAVLAFEYGVSVENPRVLPIWEAQFGDFFNGAQIIIDTFVTGGETKWLLQSALTLVLPHGMDGAGPEHSSCHIERFLQATDSSEDSVDGDDVNLQVVNPTTPAQYFHLLRRQMLRDFRKPLIIAGPKVLLRHPGAVSSLADMSPGTAFLPVLPDPAGEPAKVRRVAFVSGKHYYALAKEREARGGVAGTGVALVRMEALSPFPAGEIRAEVARYGTGTEFVWAQEEHRNAGAWSFVAPRFENVVGVRVRYAGRGVHATPATGVGEVHAREVKEIVDAVFS